MLQYIRQVLGVLIVLTLVTGLCYPLVVTGVAQLIFPHQANGSLIYRDGKAVGSELIGQAFSGPNYFHSRPSAAGNGYDGTASGGTNLGPINDKLLSGVHGSKKADGTPDPASDFDGVKDLAAAYRSENNLPGNARVPVDAVTRSGSGLDPDISVAAAELQVPRVAKARRLDEAKVRGLVDKHTRQRQLGVLGEPRVNVLELNLALDEAGERAR
jgi:potassium-transporting ATPase KdpC subunit